MPGRRSRNPVGVKPPVDRRKPIEVWEDGVFAGAVEFTVTQFLGRGNRNTARYTVAQFNEALAVARAPLAPGERLRGLYVVSRDGRSVCLERNKDEHWKQLWKTYHAPA